MAAPDEQREWIAYELRLPGLGWVCTCRYPRWVLPLLLLAGRVSFGFYLLWSGADKLLAGFSAAGFLTKASRGPLREVWVDLGSSPSAMDVVDPLVVWGEILIGGALMLGFVTRFAFLMGAAQMLLFYLAQLPPEHNPVLSEHIFYIGSFAILAILGSGRIFGVDLWIENSTLVRRFPGLRWALG